MNGKVRVWPKTNQISAINPARMPTVTQYSEILVRISQSRISQRRAALVKIDIFHDLARELLFAVPVSDFGSALRGIDGAFELSGLSVGGSEGAHEYRIAFVRELIRFHG